MPCSPAHQKLSESFVYELTRAMALPQTKSVQGLVRLLFGQAVQRFSEMVIGLDQKVEQQGPAAAARWLLPHFVSGYRAVGSDLIPAEGPLIIAANHPASYDGLVISAFVNRPDYKIVIGEILPYRYLPHVSQHVIFSPNVKNTHGRMQTVRNVIKHLEDGGAVLIFPRGSIEPDPAFMPHPDAEFDNWSRSLEIFLRRVPTTRLLVTMVSGVIAPDSMRHPITWLRRARPDRQRLAFMYQMIRQVWSKKECFGLTPRVTFGELLSGVTSLKEIEQSARRTLHRHLLEFPK
jgi:hypothetical protein